MASAFTIDLKQPFQHLKRAPIVEAVIEWQARATHSWEPDDVKAALAAKLPEYPKTTPYNLVEAAFEFRVDDDKGPSKTSHQESWRGFRLEHATEPNIAQFTRVGLAFSRLKPYEDWQRFEAEAQRLWKVFVAIGGPLEIQRLGVRYINRIGVDSLLDLGRYLQEPPSLSTQLPLSGFLYQSTFEVPGHPLTVRVVKTSPPVSADSPGEIGLVLDIDVYTTKPLPCDETLIAEFLPKMRWLKNLVFFNLLTPEAVHELS